MLIPQLYDLQSYMSRLLGITKPPLEDLLEDKEALSLARELLENLIETRTLTLPNDPREAMLAYHTTLAIVAKSGSHTLIRFFINALRSYSIDVLKREREDKVIAVARKLGLNLMEDRISIPWVVDSSGNIIPRTLKHSIMLRDYLTLAAKTGIKELHLSNSFLLNGRVYVDKQRLAILLGALIGIRAEQLMEKYRRLNLPNIEKMAREIVQKLREETGERVRLNKDLLPDCIKKILDKIESENQVSTEEIYQVISLLLNIKVREEELAGFLLKHGLATMRSYRNLATTLSKISKQYTPLDCRKSRGLKACNGVCPEGGLVRDYLRRVRAGTRDTR